MIKTKIILDLGFGDSGKGLMTDYLCCQTPNSIVVRFSGGHQAGHTVITADGKRHVFAQFGSGTLRGVPTFWSRYCTFYPTGFMKEYTALKQLGIKPRIYMDSMAYVATFYDKFYNQALEKSRNSPHGSCGVGFAATIERNLSPYKLFAKDIFYPKIFSQKLGAIKEYYKEKVVREGLEKQYEFDEAQELEIFIDCAKRCSSIIKIATEKSIFQLPLDAIIFEGSQGILLDMDFGFFPNVTRSNTTSKNAIEIIKRNNLPNPEIYYVIRAYQTRHGNGWMSNEDKPLNVKENPSETNVFDKWQGKFRKSQLDIDLINYALECDNVFSEGLTKNLTITCLDQIDGDMLVTKGKKEYVVRDLKEDFISKLCFSPYRVYMSQSECSEEMKILIRKKPASLNPIKWTNC